MRDILFRGKAIGGLNASRWIYGYYVKDFWTPSSVGHGIIPADRDIGGYCEVYPDTVGQYTGLTDKNGKRIFEGDIVVTNKFNTPEKKYTITFDEKIATYIGEGKKGCVRYFTTFSGDADAFDVIGNIHDNPELIGGAEE